MSDVALQVDSNDVTQRYLPYVVHQYFVYEDNSQQSIAATFHIILNKNNEPQQSDWCVILNQTCQPLEDFIWRSNYTDKVKAA